MAAGQQYPADADTLTANDDGLRSGPPRLLVVHTSESDGTADGLARYQLDPASGGSYHVIIDRFGRMVRSNDDGYIPWAAGYTGNRAGLHVCLTGYASWSRDEWLSRTAQLERLRDWLQWNSRTYGIPLVRLVGREIIAPARGVCGHADVSTAWREVNHTDPGADFPYDAVLDGARPDPAVHVVQRGENLYMLAHRYGTSVDALAQLNGIPDPSIIRVGQVLRLKVKR